MSKIQEILVCFLLFIKEKAEQMMKKMDAISPYIVFIQKKGENIRKTRPRDVLDFVLKLAMGIMNVPLAMMEKAVFWFTAFLTFLLVVFATAAHRLVMFGWADFAGSMLFTISVFVFLFLVWLFMKESGECRGINVNRTLGIIAIVVLIGSVGAQAATDADTESMIPIGEQNQTQGSEYIRINAYDPGGVLYLEFQNNVTENLTYHGTISVNGMTEYLDTQKLPIGSVRIIEMVINSQNYNLNFSGYGCCIRGNDFRIEFFRNITHRSEILNIVSNKLYYSTVELKPERAPMGITPLIGALLIAVICLRKKN